MFELDTIIIIKSTAVFVFILVDPGCRCAAVHQSFSTCGGLPSWYSPANWQHLYADSFCREPEWPDLAIHCYCCIMNPRPSSQLCQHCGKQHSKVKFQESPITPEGPGQRKVFYSTCTHTLSRDLKASRIDQNFKIMLSRACSVLELDLCYFV